MKLWREVRGPAALGVGAASFAVPLIWVVYPLSCVVLCVIGATGLVLADRWRWTS